MVLCYAALVVKVHCVSSRSGDDDFAGPPGHSAHTHTHIHRYVAEKYPVETRRMISESQQQRHFYLWACACINVAVQLVFYLKLNTEEMRYQGDMKAAPVSTQRDVIHVMSRATLSTREAFGELFSNSMFKLHGNLTLQQHSNSMRLSVFFGHRERLF